VTHAIRESSSPWSTQYSTKWDLAIADVGGLKLVPLLSFPRSSHALYSMYMCVGTHLYPQWLFQQLPSAILLWLFSRWHKQQLATAILNEPLSSGWNHPCCIYIPQSWLGPWLCISSFRGKQLALLYPGTLWLTPKHKLICFATRHWRRRVMDCPDKSKPRKGYSQECHCTKVQKPHI
jgi:hypothetical protein